MPWQSSGAPMAKTSAQVQQDFRDRQAPLEIPPPANPKRRGRGRSNVGWFLRTYFPDVFYNPFTDDQKRILKTITDLVKYGGQNAEAAPRGDGKTTLFTYAGFIWAIVYNHIEYGVIVGASTGQAYDNIMLPIKKLYTYEGPFADDFSEFCIPIRDVEGHAKTQIYNGERVNCKWSGSMFIFPTIKRKGSTAQGQIITTRGLDSAIRGLVYQGKRPQLILIDDPQTDESARNPTEIRQRRKLIETSLLGMAGPGRKLGVAYLGTVIQRGDLTDQLTDRKLTPAWRGRKQQFITKWPKHDELWIEYTEILQKELTEDDNSQGRLSHAFYLKNRRKMDLGHQTNNPYRFDGTQLEDGSQREVSAIQHSYNKKINMGDEAFNSEYQNQPPDDAVKESVDITINMICKKLTYLDRGVVPAWAEIITCGVDVGSRVLHYVVTAWREGAIGAVIDYGTEDVHRDPDQSSKKHLQEAIKNALIDFYQVQVEEGYPMANTEASQQIDAFFIDSGWQPEPVYSFCRAAQRCWPCKGFGTVKGQRRYIPPPRKSADKHWHKQRQKGAQVTLINLDSDHYKNQVHWGFIAGETMPGSISLYGREPFTHRDFAYHITSEKWEREYIPGKGFIEHFVSHSRKNHYLDCLAYSAAAASGLGYNVIRKEAAAS